MLDAPESEDTLREYGELFAKMEDCFYRIKILKHKADEVKALKLREVDDKKKIARYDLALNELKKTCNQVREELSKYDARVKELDAYQEPGTDIRNKLSSSKAYNSPSRISG